MAHSSAERGGVHADNRTKRPEQKPNFVLDPRFGSGYFPNRRMEQPAEEGEALRALIARFVTSGAAGQRLKDPEILFGMNAGSYAFNLNVETSDRDYFGVYAAHAEDILAPYGDALRSSYCL